MRFAHRHDFFFIVYFSFFNFEGFGVPYRRSLLTKIQIMKSKYQKQMRKKNLEQDDQQERDCYQIFMVFGSTTLNVSKIHLLSKKQ